MVLVPDIGLSTTIFNNTHIHPQHFRKFMCVHWECAWCYCQTLDLAPPYPKLHKYTYSTLESSCVSTENTYVWCQCIILVLVPPYIPHYTNTPTVLQKHHVFPLGMCVVLVPNIGISSTVYHTTQIRLQYFTKFMCVNWKCAWCYCQILILAPLNPTLQK